jgi:hypothetical protein
MKLDLNTARLVLSMGILGLAAVVVVVIVVIDTLTNRALPGYIVTVGGFLLGFATHELGVSRGISSLNSTLKGLPSA